MTTLFKILFVNFFFVFFPDNNCNVLSNGTYKFIQTFSSSTPGSNPTLETRVLIKDAHFTQYWPNGDSASGKIEWIGDCTFKFLLDKPVEETNELGKLLRKSFGDPCFELKDKRGKKRRFRTTYTGNIHVTTSEGVIIKLR